MALFHKVEEQGHMTDSVLDFYPVIKVNLLPPFAIAVLQMWQPFINHVLSCVILSHHTLEMSMNVLNSCIIHMAWNSVWNPI